jgi:hypothetical protein
MLEPFFHGRSVLVRPFDTDCEGAGEGLEVNDNSRLEWRLHLHQIELVVANEPFRKFGCQLPDGGEVLPRHVEIKAIRLGHDF